MTISALFHAESALGFSFQRLPPSGSATLFNACSPPALSSLRHLEAPKRIQRSSQRPGLQGFMQPKGPFATGLGITRSPTADPLLVVHPLQGFSPLNSVSRFHNTSSHGLSCHTGWRDIQCFTCSSEYQRTEGKPDSKETDNLPEVLVPDIS